MMKGRHGLLVSGLVLACLAGPASAVERGVLYKRAARPQFSSKAIRSEYSRVVFDKLDIKNNTFTALVVREREVLYGLDFTFVPPPERLRVGQSFELSVSVRAHRVGPDESAQRVADVQFVLTPDETFTASGYPLKQTSEAFPVDALQAALGGTDPDSPLTQKLTVTFQSGEASSLVCGYTLRLGWGTDLHEVAILYPFKRGKGWWSTAAGPGHAAMDVSRPEPAAVADGPVMPKKPWREEAFVRFFAGYVADLNDALRAERGKEWAVDAWGREVGPTTSLPVRPEGRWENPNHYLWEKNAPYDFYPLTIRDYLEAKWRGRSAGEDSGATNSTP